MREYELFPEDLAKLTYVKPKDTFFLFEDKPKVKGKEKEVQVTTVKKFLKPSILE